jgi:hypothetical protein
MDYLLDYINSIQDEIKQHDEYIKNNEKKLAEEKKVKPKSKPRASKGKKKVEEIVVPVVESTKKSIALLDENIIKDLMHQRTLIKNNNPNDVKNKERLSVTEDFCGCIRKSYYMFKGYKRNYDGIYSYGNMVMSIGNLIHDILQESIPSKFNEYSYVLNDVFPLPISGRIDMILNDDVLVEFKSCSSKIKKPKPEHMKQGMIYTTIVNKFLKDELKCDIKTMQLIYIVRSNMDSIVFNAPVTDEIMNQFYHFMRGFTESLVECLNKNEPPYSNNPFINREKCDYCYFKNICR